VFDDGAAYNPATHTWRMIAAAPLPPLTGVATVWTGREMLVWGGATATSGMGRLSSGAAAYDPSTDSWRLLSPSPPGFAMERGHGVWAAGRAVFAAGATLTETTASAVSILDLATGSWRQVRLDGRAVDLATDGATVAVAMVPKGPDRGAPRISRLDPASGTLRPLPSFSAPQRPFELGVTFRGDVLVATSRADLAEKPVTRVQTAGPGADTWSEALLGDDEQALAATSVQFDIRKMPLISTRGYLLSYTSEGVARLDMDHAELATTRNRGGTPCATARSAIVWTGSAFISWGGNRCDARSGALADGATISVPLP
jgi:hypothetical protein